MMGTRHVLIGSVSILVWRAFFRSCGSLVFHLAVGGLDE